MKIQYSVSIFIIFTLAACGFQLRGTYLDELQDANIFISARSASAINREVRMQLQQAGIKLTENPATADYTINLKGEQFNKEVLSVSPVTGKVEEFEIIYRVEMDIIDSKSSDVLRSDILKNRRDYAFDELAALSKYEEEEIIRNEIIKDTASQIIRSLVAISRRINAT